MTHPSPQELLAKALEAHDCEIRCRSIHGPTDYDALLRVSATLTALQSKPTGEETPMTEDQIKHMANRFLSWKLPADFHPDNGITFDPISNQFTPYERRREPVGTNLFTATQAEQMVRYMLEGLPTDEGASE